MTKACRYDEPHWSNCDPFELTKYKVFKLVSGGRQCEEEKRVTERCTPYDLPAGTKWLIAEHRRCISGNSGFKKLFYVVFALKRNALTLISGVKK